MLPPSPAHLRRLEVVHHDDGGHQPGHVASEARDEVLGSGLARDIEAEGKGNEYACREEGEDGGGRRMGGGGGWGGEEDGGGRVGSAGRRMDGRWQIGIVYTKH